jgi:hypothetical protein
MFNLYHNKMPGAGMKGGVIAIRFVGGNRTAAASKTFACRDGYGARVTLDVGGKKIVREHRCGDGWSTQNSATMIVGIGAQAKVSAVSVRWPSGKISSTTEVPEGTLLTVYENPADAPAKESFVRAEYRTKKAPAQPTAIERPVFPLATLDTRAKPGTRLRVYTTFATSCATCDKNLPLHQRLREELAAEGVDLIAVPIDETDDNQKLAAYNREHRPAVRLVNIRPDQRKQTVALFGQALGEEAPLPSTVITDGTGRILAAQAGLPSVSAIRKLLGT